MPAAGRNRLARGLIVAAAPFALLALLATAVDAAYTLLGLIPTPVRLGIDGLAMLIAGLASLAAGVMVAVLAARSELTERQLLTLGLGFLLAVRLAAVLLVDAPIAPDGSAYQDLAVRIMGQGVFLAHRPTGYPALLAAAYQLLGNHHLAHELLNLAFAMAGGWLLFDLARRLAGRQAAIGALIAYAILPGLLLLTPVRLTDTVYATLVIALCWAGSRMSEGRIRWAVVAGLVLAACQYVRPTGPVLLAAVLTACLVTAISWRQWLPLALAMTMAFVIAMLPAFAHNLTTYGDLSPSTSSFGGWSLYMGSNQASNGGYNRADAEFIHGLPGPLWDQSALAGRLAVERIATDPVGFAGLAVRKFSLMWGTEHFVVQYGMDFGQAGGPQGVEVAVNLVAQLAWLVLLLSVSAALLMTWRHRHPHPVVIVAVCIVLAEAILHLFVEVKPRYHAHLEPLLIVIAAPAIAHWLSAGWRRGDILRGVPDEPNDQPKEPAGRIAVERPRALPGSPAAP